MGHDQAQSKDLNVKENSFAGLVLQFITVAGATAVPNITCLHLIRTQKSLWRRLSGSEDYKKNYSEVFI